MQGKGSFTSRIAGFCYVHKWYVLGAWLALIITAVILSAELGGLLTTNTVDLSNSDSARATKIISQRFGQQPFTETVIIRSDTDTVASPAFQKTAVDLAANVRQAPGVTQVVTYAEAPTLPFLVSKDKHAGLVTVVLSGDEKQVNGNIAGVVSAINGASRPSGYTINGTGAASASHELNKISEHDTQRAESIGIPIALIVMVIAFGAVVAALIPLLLGIAAIAPAVGVVALIATFYQLNFLVTSIISMIGLAVGIDYSLFIMGRYREELARQHTPVEAMRIASDSSGRAVFFSGITVLLALSAMLFVRINVFVSMGVGAMIVVAFAVLGSLTLLPALLSLFGRHINALPVPFLGKAQFGHRFWSEVTKLIQRYPVLFVAGSIILLLACAFPLTQIDLGTSGIEGLPHNTAAFQGIAALERDFPAGLSDPMMLVVQGSLAAPAAQQGIGRLQAAIGQQSNLQWIGVQTDAAGNAAIIRIATTTIGTGDAAQKIVHNLRSTVIPDSLKGSGLDAFLGGSLPGYVDVKSNMESRLVPVFAYVLGLSFLLLLLVFRSIAIPAKAIVMNLLSVGAAYGLLVLVFQKGFLAGPLGFRQTPQIEFYLPLFTFSILFGLSMDYEVFLLSRIKEEYDRTGDNRDAVRAGVVGTAGMITSAALIMVAVFAGFSRGSMSNLQQMGFSLAVAVFLDATVVRSILVPSAMELLGHLNWWMPRWLDWLPHISVEGSSALASDTERSPVAPSPSTTGAGD